MNHHSRQNQGRNLGEKTTITATIGQDGKGKVPNSDLPDVETPGTGKDYRTRVNQLLKFPKCNHSS